MQVLPGGDESQGRRTANDITGEKAMIEVTENNCGNCRYSRPDDYRTENWMAKCINRNSGCCGKPVAIVGWCTKWEENNEDTERKDS